VLLVEDEMMVALLLEQELADLGYEVVGPVGHLNNALEMAQREAVDVGILDVNINGAEVFPVAEALAARDIPFVFVTGYGRQGLSPLYRNSPTLQKPFHMRDLRAALEAACLAKRN
jgi:DNA-binding response OmpR family regulator